jgi:cellulose synthase/poly-beta-1,6-N-acetylglucosamine synthase-like glycosyltransferase
MKNDTIVLMPNYNDARGVKKSLGLFSEQEVVDVLVVDDGSVTDLINEEEIRQNFKGKGTVTFLYLEQNGGIIKALNRGLEYIRTTDYKFIARLDAGDICLDNRFKRQREFLLNEPNIHLVGAHIRMLDMNGKFLFNIKVPTNPEEIRKKIYVSSSVVIHPTIMFKVEILEKIKGYPTEYYTEDYALYFEVLKHYNISNVDLFLLEKELNPNSMSLKNRKRQASARLDVLKDNFYFGFYPIYGYFRNYILYLVPNKILIRIKRLVLR